MSRTPRATVAAAVIAALAALTAACGGTHHHQGAPNGTVPITPRGGASSAPPASSSAAVSSAAVSSAAASIAAPSVAAAATTASATPSTSASATPSPKPTPVKTIAAPPAGGSASGVDILAGTDCQIFPTDNYWHADIASLPVDPRSAAWLKAMGASSRNLHPDFGPSDGAQAVPYGIPITIVPVGQVPVAVKFTYASESDPGPYPLGPKTLIEGGANSGGDQHAIMVTASTCQLFETWDTSDTSSGWTAGSGAHWSLSSDALRPSTWTSADAAGLPILPGLLRYDEVASGHVDHAIRFTTNVTSDSFLWPARHEAGSQTNENLYPPMGARFRLNAGFNISHYSAQAQTVLRAMKTYGLVLADNGSPWYFQGTADNAWPDALIEELKTIPASAFQAVDTSSLEISANSGAAR
jgi:hypothetical protein